MSHDPTGRTALPDEATPALRTTEILDGNEAVARTAYRLSEVIAIYPITPASGMAELCDQWATEHRPNLWGTVPDVIEMQSEAGAAGTLHGAAMRGALATTFTASQGLLLMMPNMFKLAGELTPTVIHVAARAVATHALSIFGDHSDVMAVRSTGFAMLSAGSVQEAADLALISHAATLASRVPFLNFFDGFRTSHEVSTVEIPTDDDVRALIDEDAIAALRGRGLDPDHPTLRGTAQNPDVFFQAREAINPFVNAVPGIVEELMGRLALRTGRRYGLVDYYGAPDAERVIVVMGSGVGAIAETVDALAGDGGEGRVWCRSGCTGRSRCRRSWPPFPRRLPASRCSIAPRRPAPPATRFSSTCPRRSERERRTRRGPHHAFGHRRPLRAGVEGVHADHGTRGVRQSRIGQPSVASPSESSTT